MVVRYGAGKLSRRDFTRRVLRLTILKAFRLLMTFPSERIGRCGGGNSSGVRALGFKDDRLKRRSRASCRGRYRWRWLDLVYVRLHRLENSYVANCNSMLATWTIVYRSKYVYMYNDQRTNAIQTESNVRTYHSIRRCTDSRCYVSLYRIALLGSILSYRVVSCRIVSGRITSCRVCSQWNKNAFQLA